MSETKSIEPEKHGRGRPKKGEVRPKPVKRGVGRPKKYSTEEEYREAKYHYNQRYQAKLKETRVPVKKSLVD